MRGNGYVNTVHTRLVGGFDLGAFKFETNNKKKVSCDFIHDCNIIEIIIQIQRKDFSVYEYVVVFRVYCCIFCSIVSFLLYFVYFFLWIFFLSVVFCILYIFVVDI